MENVISKELLSEVLEWKIPYELRTKKIGDNLLIFEQFENGENLYDEWNINIHELAFRTREYLKTKSKNLSLNQSIDDIFKEANDIYESLSK